jgi:pimeloyl-ACP methyl ester carboxylesterase
VQEADRAEILRLFPAAQFTAIAGAGHWVHAEQPSAFAAVVLDFLQGVTP